MRLTLRTLLAYLDDRLSPANARELGQKISASPFARELSERIRGVVRKRRLATPEAGQKQIDANLIAEYLDDQLTPELVALIEKEILASDQALAEVAATHQILGLLADPLEIDDKLQKRLRQMDPVAEAEAGGAVTEAEISAKEDWKPLAPVSTGSKRSPMLLLAVMVFGWLALLFLDSNLYRSPSEAVVAENPVAAPDDAKPDDVNKNNPAQAAMNQDSGRDEPDANQPSQVAPEVDPDILKAKQFVSGVGNNAVSKTEQPEASDAVPTVNNGEATSNPVMADSSDTTNNPATTNNPGTATDNAETVAPSDGSSIPAPNDVSKNETAMADSGQPVDAVDPKPSVFSPHLFFVNDPSSTLILSSIQKADAVGGAEQQDPEGFGPPQIEWRWASELEGSNNWNNLLSQRLACVSSPFRCTVGCQASGWKVQVIGSSLFRGIDEKHAGLTVLSGRLILERTVAANPEPFLLQAGDQQILLNPTETDQRLAVTVHSIPVDSDQGYSLLSTDAPVVVSLAAFGSPIEIAVAGADQSTMIPSGSEFTLRSDSERFEAPIRQPLLKWEWVEKAMESPTAASTELLATLSKQLKQHALVRDAVVSVSEDGNPVIAEWAVQIPKTERNVEQLVGLLFQSTRQAVRSASFFALQEIAQTVPGGQQAIVSLLETRLNANEMQQAMRMISEISKVSLEDRLTSAWLVDMLNSDRLVLREMAISTLEKYMNNRNNYFADDEKSRRDRATRRWKSELDRNDGRLLQPLE